MRRGFLYLVAIMDWHTVAETSPPVAVELRLRGGRSLHFESTIDPTALSVLIRAVDVA